MAHKEFHTRNNSGAALVIAVGILTVLLIIALSFFQITREEMKAADNYSNDVRTDMLADGAIALATAFLQHDEIIHPTATSLDAAFKSYFTGTWAAGKDWAASVDGNTINSPTSRSIINGYPPLVNLEYIDYYRDEVRGLPRLNLQTSRFIDHMYIPRIENNSKVEGEDLRDDLPMVVQAPFRSPGGKQHRMRSVDNYMTKRHVDWETDPYAELFPFLISNDSAEAPIMRLREFFGLPYEINRHTKSSDLNEPYRLTMRGARIDDNEYQPILPVEQIHFFTDVDLNRDGYNDAIWIPISADRLFPNDGLDNDLDGFIDEEDLDGEPALFMYRGNIDGVDNDFDDLVDEEDEREYIVFTMPLDKMFSVYVPAYEVPSLTRPGTMDIIEEDLVPVYDPRDSADSRSVSNMNVFANELSYIPDGINAPTTENAPNIILGANYLRVDGNHLTYDRVLPQSERPSLATYLYNFRDDDSSGIINDGVDARQYLINPFVSRSLRGVEDEDAPDPDREAQFYFYGDLITRIIALKNELESNLPGNAPRAVIQVLGEPLSEIVSRVAILITDEASKVNINEAGGRTYLRKKSLRNKNFGLTNPDPDDLRIVNPPVLGEVDQWPLAASLNMGNSTQEYELSMLPNITQVSADRMWNYRTGAPDGIGFPSFMYDDEDPYNLVLDDFAEIFNYYSNNGVDFLLDNQVNVFDAFSNADLQPFYYDVSLPGYGRADDNANLFLLAFNGIDDDGDAIYYQTDGIDNNMNNHADTASGGIADDGIDNDGDGDVDEVGEGIDEPGEGALVGTDEGFRYWNLDDVDQFNDDDYLDDLPGFEGVDEPSELQRFRPYRHFIAEADDFDADNDPYDYDLDGNDEIGSFSGDNDGDAFVNEIGELGDVAFRTSAQLTLALNISKRYTDFLMPFVTTHSTDRNIRHQHLPRSFGSDNADNRIISGHKLDYNFASAKTIALALLEDWNYVPSRPLAFRNDTGTLDPSRNREISFFAQGLRQEDTNVYGRLMFQPNGTYVWQMAPDPELRAHQIAANIKDFTDTNHSRTELIVQAETHLGPQGFVNLDPKPDGTTIDADPWMFNLAKSDQIANLGKTHEMYYTQTGVEVIRINEIMVRPVRRFEAEAFTNTPPVGEFFELPYLFLDAQSYHLPTAPLRALDFIHAARYSPNQFSMPDPDFITGVPNNLDVKDFDFYVTRMEDKLRESVLGNSVPNSLIDELKDRDIYYRGLEDTEFEFDFPIDPLDDEYLVKGARTHDYWVSPAIDPIIEANLIDRFPGMSLLGIKSAWTTYENTIPIIYQPDEAILDPLHENSLNERVIEVPNIIQFSFKASPQLPPGRYYLTMNSLLADPGVGVASETAYSIVNTVTDPGDYAFFFRVGTANEDVFTPFFDSDNFDDEEHFPAAFLAATDAEQEFWQNPAAIGKDRLGNFTGMSFMQAASIFSGGVARPGPSYSVVIPEIGDEDNPTYLHVAIWRTKKDKPVHGEEQQPLAVNYFEFSQEPDHEWVELAHIDPRGEPVDLSNWVLAVENTEPPVELIIPTGTVITPGGYLLLGTDVRDDFDGNIPNASNIGFGHNGIGLAKTHQQVTVPPTAPPFINNNIVFGYEYTDVSALSGSEVDPTLGGAEDAVIPTNMGSVFDPAPNGLDNLATDDDGNPIITGLNDFVDNNGDGLRDDRAYVRDDEIQSSPDSARVNSAFDRMIELVVPHHVGANTAAEIGRIVLQGGIFPNYPERDGIDNDGDRFILQNDGIDNDGDFAQSLLENSLPTVDNFANNGIDERVTIDLATQAGFEPAILGNGVRTRFKRYERSPSRYIPSEGVDEGRWRRHPPKSFGLKLNGDPQFPIPGSFSPFAIPFNYVLYDLANNPMDRTIINNVDDERYFIPNENTDPVWKEFYERRLYPGDNVIITLYEAPRNQLGAEVTKHDRIVDRVTYNERDVVNRNIDDIRSINVNGILIREPLNGNFLNMWPEDTMGIDFYRSLERKHPFYNGDRFGVQNRFQVTDGNYDDWSESTGLWQRINQLSTADSLYAITTVPDLDARLDLELVNPDNRPNNDLYRLIAHAYHGSPLRMNFSQRRMEDPVSDRMTGRSVLPPEYESNNVVSRGQFNTYNKTEQLPEEYRWPWLKPRIPNKFMTSPGELMTLSHFETQYRTLDPDIAALSDNQTIDDVNLNDGEWYGSELNYGQALMYNHTSNQYTTHGISYLYSARADANAGDWPFIGDYVQNNQIILSHRFRDDFRDRDNLRGFGGESAGGDYIDARWENDVMNDLHAVISNAASTDTVSLHVGTSEASSFVFNVGYIEEDFFWTNGANPGKHWAPLFLFQLPNGLDLSAPYPYKNKNVIHDRFNPFLFNDLLFTASLPDIIDPVRWPQNQRAVLFTSRNIPRAQGDSRTWGYDPDDNFDRSNFNAATRNGAGAYFVWDANDGLENGEYDLFVGIAEPLYALDQIQRTYRSLYFGDQHGIDHVDIDDDDTSFGTNYVNQAIRSDHSEMLVDIEIFTDKDGNGTTWGNSTFDVPVTYRQLNSGSNVDDDTNTETRNESLGQIQDVVPDIDGFVHYGPVRIENNHLGVFIRNRATTDIINRFSRVVLTPRNKTAGRLNINTTMSNVVGASRQFDIEDPFEREEGIVFNPLTGLPGILFDLQPNYLQMGTHFQDIQNDIGPPQRTFYHNIIADWETGDGNFQNAWDAGLDFNLRSRWGAIPAAFRAHLLTVGRPEHPDGRYYEHISDLVTPYKYLDPDDGTVLTRQANKLSEYTNASNHSNIQRPVFQTPPLRSDNNDSLNFDETYERFRRTANLITTRSNVFEIIVKVQTGYVTDENDDGILNYRDDKEFTITGEKDARAIYER